MKAFSYQHLNLLFLVNLSEHLRVLLLRSLKKLNYAQLLMHMLSFWYSHEKEYVLLVDDSPQGRSNCAAPLAS